MLKMVYPHEREGTHTNKQTHKAERGTPPITSHTRIFYYNITTILQYYPTKTQHRTNVRLALVRGTCLTPYRFVRLPYNFVNARSYKSCIMEVIKELSVEKLHEYVSGFSEIGVTVEDGNIILEDVAIPWRAVEIMVYGSTDEFYDCAYEDVCNYLALE